MISTHSFANIFVLYVFHVSFLTAVILNRGYLEYWYPSYETATKIDLTQYDIDSIDPNTFAQLVNLNELYLGNNLINNIDNASTFDSLINLRVLSLSNNQLVSLNQNIFYGLTNLESVYLDRNPISLKQPSYVISLCSTNPKCKIYL